MSNEGKVLQPNMGKLAVEVLRRPVQVSKGGIVLPNERAPYTLARIYAVGLFKLSPDGSKEVKSQFHEGDVIIIQPYVGNTIIVGGKHYLVVPESDVICRVLEGAEITFGLKEDAEL